MCVRVCERERENEHAIGFEVSEYMHLQYLSFSGTATQNDKNADDLYQISVVQ